MHISKVSLVNYRNFKNTNVHLVPGVNTIIGENGSGKSNLFRAIRLLLDERLVSRRYALEDGDFHRGLGDWRGHWIVIKLEFGNVSNDESVQSLVLQHTAEESSGNTERATYALVFRPKIDIRNSFAKIQDGDHDAVIALRDTITVDDYEQVLLGKMSIDLTDAEQYKQIVGDFEAAHFPRDEFGNAPSFNAELGYKITREVSLWKEFSLSFVPALRDVVSDFSDIRRNPLRTLLAEKSQEIPEGDLDEIINKIKNLNSDIEKRDDVQEITRGIHKTFKDTIGETYSPTSMEIQSELPLDAADLFKSLKLYVGEHGDSQTRRLHEMSLGGANLIYLTLKLLEFQYRSARQAIANFLLIEEPEAHIHTHVQKTLFDRVTYANTQIIYSTHSTHISEVSKIEHVNVLARDESAWVALQPAAGLKTAESEAAQRFLDAIRSNLLFARSVILVEGDAEEILIPNLVKKVYGISLDELGISLVNVRSTGFKTLARLFHEDRLRKRCAIITDYDQAYFDVSELPGEDETLKKLKKRAARSAKAGADRKDDLDAFQYGNNYLHIAYAPHTFEVDFANASEANRAVLSSTVDEVYKQDGKRRSYKSRLQDDEIATHGLASLELAEKAKKGWFALLVSAKLDEADCYGGPELPGYIIEALRFVAPELPVETWVRVLKHRVLAWSTYRNALADAALEEEETARAVALAKAAAAVGNAATATKEMIVRLEKHELPIHDVIQKLLTLDYVDLRMTTLWGSDVRGTLHTES